jgi:hypothetical protein
MNAICTVMLTVYMAVHLATQVGIAAPATPPASGQIQMERTPATMVSVPSAPLPPCPQPCPCQVQQPCCNVAPWSWQHDNQNDDQWPADHGG